MNPALFKVLVVFMPVGMLFSGAVVLFWKRRNASSLLQMVGTGCLVVVVLTHICEALHLFPWMHWGLEHSAGHYLDLSSAVSGLTLFPLGYFWAALRTPKGSAAGAPPA